MQDNYFNNRAEKTIERTRGLLDELPSFAIEYFIGMQNRTSELTRLNYAFDLRIFFDFLSKKLYKNRLKIDEIALADLDKLTAFDIELYLEYLSDYTFNGKRLKCKEHSKQRKLASLRSFFKYYFKKDKLTANITSKVDMPKIHDKPIIRLEVDEVVKLLNAAETAEDLNPKQRDFHKYTKKRDVAILTLFLGTGIRISELIGINRNDIDFNANAFIIMRKGGNYSQLYFSDEIKKALSDYIEWLDTDPYFIHRIKNRDALFLSLQGTRISVRAVENLVKKYSRIIAPLKKITPHKLRSTYGTSLYRETQDIYIVADVLGHKDINTTKKHYAAISDDIRRKASTAVKLKPDSDGQ